MAYLASATALVGLLAVANLLFTFGVVRRLREHTAELSSRRAAARPDDGVALPAGAKIGEFTAESAEGQPVTLDSMGTLPLVGFFSPGCGPCKERLPTFVAYAAARPGGRDGVLAVVAGTAAESTGLVEQLTPVATVVVEPDHGPLQRAFAVEGFPAFVLAREGRVVVSDFDLASITDADGAASPAIG